MGWLLIIVDARLLIEDGYITKGESTSTGGLKDEKYSSRYGHFHQHTNKWEDGQKVTYAMLSEDDKAMGMSIAMGDRVGSSHMQLMVFGWFFYLFFTAIVMALRTSVREVHKISGSVLEDALVAIFFYPTAIIQCNEVLERGTAAEDKLNA